MHRIDVDRWGAWVGTLCAIHCALSGFALGLLSWFGLSFIGSESTEIAFVASAVLLGGFAVFVGYRRHRSLLPTACFLTGLTSIGLSHFGFGHGSVGGAVCSIMGGLFLVTFHVLNQRCRPVVAGTSFASAEGE